MRTKPLNWTIFLFIFSTVSFGQDIKVELEILGSKTLFFDLRGHTTRGNHIGLLGEIQGDTLTGWYIHFDKDELLIQLKLEYSHTAHEINEMSNLFHLWIKKS